MRTADLLHEPKFLTFLHGVANLRWFRLAVAGWHFQVDAVSFLHDHIWDSTSLVLRKGIRLYAEDGQRVLDLGTGHLGLLAVYCARTHSVNMIAVDVNKEFVENARLIASASSAPAIEFRQSDWFSHVDGAFDLIFSNCPYIPTEAGHDLEHAQPHPEIWDGGHDGLAHVRTILANAGRFLKPVGLLLLGIDTRYIERSTTLGLIETTHDLELRHIVESWISSSEVYVIRLGTPGGSVC
jgi:methylase of polypeptide subunit release factors